MRMKIIKTLACSLAFGLIGVVFAQPAPILEMEPDYTAGYFNPILWRPPTSPGATITAWEIWVDTASVGVPIWPIIPDAPGPAEISIFPIPTATASAWGDTFGAPCAYPVGREISPSPADDPLTSGVRYCYKVRYRWNIGGPGGTFGFSGWSETYCSSQDANPPDISIETLPYWVNFNIVDLRYTATDRLVGIIDSLVLYYRVPPSTTWIRYGARTTTPPYEGIFPFNSATVSGDTIYQFYLAGWDRLRNGTIPVGTFYPPMAQTRVDDTNPASSIITTGLPVYYTGWSGGINLFFTATDGYSGVDAVFLDTDYGTGFTRSIDSAFFGGAHAFPPDTFVFSRTENGVWNIRTAARDVAGNRETETAWDWTIYVDTYQPDFTIVQVFDTTSAPHRFDVPAYSGWTNSQTVTVVPVSAIDPIIDGYASGIDTVMVASNSAFTEHYRGFHYPATPYRWVSAPGDGRKDVYVKLRDVAGNKSDFRYGIIKLDTQPPALSSIVLFNRSTPGILTDTTISLTVGINITLDPLHGHACGIYFTQNLSDLNSITASEWEPLDGEYSYTFTGFSSGDWMTLYAVVRDSAGNVSMHVSDNIRYIADDGKWVRIMRMRDIDGPDTTGRYTDTTLVSIRIRYGAQVDTVFVWDGSSVFPPPDTFFFVPDPIGAYGETTIVGKLDRDDGWHMISVRGKKNYDPVLTPPDSSMIELDLQPPRITSFRVEDLTTHTETTPPADIADPGWTNNVAVKAFFVDPFDVGGHLDGTGIYRYRLSVGATELSIGPFPAISRVEFTLPTGDIPNRVLGEVQDSAGNWSSERSPDYFDITLDTRAPIINSVTLRDASTLSPDYTDEPTIIVEISGSDAPYAPAYASIFEDAGGYPGNVRARRVPFGSGLLSYTLTDTMTGGVKTVYVALMDRAGNISARYSDNIVYNRQISLNMVLFDANDPSNTRCTNSPTVGVRLNYTGTPPAFYFISERSNPTDTTWIPYPGDGDTLFTIFVDPSEGLKVLYGWLLSESGIVSEMDQDSIYLDMTPPIMDEGFFVWDTTSSDRFPTVFKAAMGWSNSRYIYGQVTSAFDAGCGVDSVRFFGGIELSLWRPIPFNINVIDNSVDLAFGVDSVPLIMDTSTEGRRVITAQLSDVAGNWGNVFTMGSEITIHGGYDVTPPDFQFLNYALSPTESVTTVRPSALPLLITDNPAPGFVWKVCWQINRLSTQISCTTYDTTWNSPIENVYFAAFPRSLAGILVPNQHYDLSVVVIDSAGNPSALKTADLLIIPDTVGFGFAVVDIDDTLDSDYCGECTVMTVITIPNPPDQMRFGSSPSALGAWMPYSRTSTYRFPLCVDGMKYVFAQVRYGAQTSRIESDSIILDQIPPTISAVTAFDITTGDPNYSDDRTIGLKAIGARDTPPGKIGALLVSEDPAFTVNVQKCPLNLADSTATYIALQSPTIPEDETPSGEVRQDARTFYVKLLDRAENYAPVRNAYIVIDLDENKLTNFPNPFDPDKEPTFIRVKGIETNQSVEVSVYDNYGNLVWKTSASPPAGSRSVDILWNGKNGKGDVIASGVYVAVVDVGGKTFKRKIAVWKGGE